MPPAPSAEHATCLAMPAIACVLTLSASCLLLLTANQAKLVMVLLNVKTCKQEGAAGGGGFDTGRGCLAAEGISLAQQAIQGTVLPASLPYFKGQQALPSFSAAQVKRR